MKNKFSQIEASNTIGMIVTHAIDVEMKISNVIIAYFEPKKDLLFQSILLDSNIMGYGQKLKVLSNLDYFEKNIIEKLRKLGQIRNSVAHNSIALNIHFRSEKKKFRITEAAFKLKVMNSSGKIIEKDFEELKSDFYNLHTEVSEYLKNYLEKIKEEKNDS